MENAKILCYDGSFNGFLSAVYRAFEARITVEGFQHSREVQNALFADTLMVPTRLEHAKRVWYGIERKHHQAVKKIYFAFLSERKGVERLLFHYIQSLVGDAAQDRSLEPGRLLQKVEALADLVAQEKKRMEADLHFRKERGQVALAIAAPDFNILPLISRHFRSRYPHSAWIIYDRKRQYGLYYHEHSMELIRLSPAEMDHLLAANQNPSILLSSGTVLQETRQGTTGYRQLNGAGRVSEQPVVYEKRAV